jgi:PiT family inorganic phosphate transporter
MAEITATKSVASGQVLRDLDAGFVLITQIALFTVLGAGLSFVGWCFYNDTSDTISLSEWAGLVMVAAALVVALVFQFANGFHDTANAAATVIYTHSLTPQVAVVWSGIWNFIGVLASTGIVTFGVVALLPQELVLQSGQNTGLAMIFAILLSALTWNLATWYVGLPSSSSHALIGAIMGVSLSYHWLYAQDGLAEIDWSRVRVVGLSLLISPIVGFGCAAVLLALSRTFIRNPDLYKDPSGEPPSWWIRALLIFTCTGVSFAHGSNDGQKGIGLIMLILVTAFPAAYALDRSMPSSSIAQLVSAAGGMQKEIGEIARPAQTTDDPRKRLSTYLSSAELTDEVLGSLSILAANITRQVTGYGSFKNIPVQAVRKLRKDIYLVSESIELMAKSEGGAIGKKALAAMERFERQLDRATRFIPEWVRLAVAIALGFGTMLGWKRVTVTVGERIGKSHLTYAQGGAAELVALCTIMVASGVGFSVSTTHVLSSGVAGAMTASGSRLQSTTVRNIGLAWILTLPVTMTASGVLYCVLRQAA